MWQRFMDRVLAETKVKERFTEHDLRAKVASDAASLDKARALFQHADGACLPAEARAGLSGSKSEAVARLNETPRLE